MAEESYTITFSESEKYAMSYICIDTESWVQNVCHERARVAKEELIKVALDKFIQNKTTIPLSHDDMIIQAFENGWIKSLKEREEENKKLNLIPE